MHTRDELLTHLNEEQDVLRSPEIRRAFTHVDRKDFVLPDYAVEAYEDYPLPIGKGQTISQPTTVAFMLEKLGPKPGDRVLDIGSGSGWVTALLAHVVGEKGTVTGIERIPELVTMGQKNLLKYGFAHAHIEPAGEQLGKPDESPFDRILVSASADDEHMAEELLRQLKKGGTMVIPIRDSIVVYEKRKTGETTRVDYPGFAFVPLIEDEPLGGNEHSSEDARPEEER